MSTEPDLEESGRVDDARATLLAAMSAALEEEIEAVRARGETRTLTFGGGRLVRTVAGTHQYLLQLPHAPGRLDAVTVTVVVPGSVVTAELLEVDERELLVATGRDLGDSLAAGTVEVDPSAVLEATLRRLTDVATGEAVLDWTTIDQIVGIESADGIPAPSEDLPAGAVEGLDPYQAEAAAACAAGTVTFVWGPPGTGKTRTLGRLAAHLTAAGQRVLLVAHAHVAVDAALVAALSAGCAGVLRIGTPQLGEVPARVVRDRMPDDPPSAGLVAATLSKVVVSDDLSRCSFDHVLVDEASMAQLPQVLLAGGLAPRMSVFGDVRQLPPVVASRGSAVHEWLGRDAFSSAGVAASIDRGRPDPRLHLLRRQYRSHPRIAAVTNRLAYAGRLESAPGTEAHDTMTAAPPLPGEPVVLVDTSSLSPVAVRPARSRCSPLASVVTGCIAHAAAAAAPALTGGTAMVGLATPYVEQVRLLRALLEDLGRGDDVVLHTVHRFQGGEREMMLVDLPDARPLRPPPFLRGDQGLRLVNVAFSRARSKLVVVADRHWLRDGVCREATSLVAGEGAVVDAADVVAAAPGVAWFDIESFLEEASAGVAASVDRVLVRAPRLQDTILSDGLMVAARACERVVVVTDARADGALLSALTRAGARVSVTSVADRLVVSDTVTYVGNTVSAAASAGRAMLRVEAPLFARRLAAALGEPG